MISLFSVVWFCRNELRARLKNGEDVTLPDGRKVLSKDVTLPGEPPVKVLSMNSIQL